MADSQRSPGRPVGGRAFDRDDVVQAALEAMAVGGYPALSMRGVARSIGASLATVQRHFATKDELWRAAVEAFFGGFALPTEITSERVLYDSIVMLLERGESHAGMIMQALSDRSAGSTERFAHIADQLRARHEVIHAALTDAQDHGVIRRVDAGALLLLLNVGLAAVASSSHAARELYGFELDDAADRRRLADSLVDIIGLGLAPRPDD